MKKIILIAIMLAVRFVNAQCTSSVGGNLAFSSGSSSPTCLNNNISMTLSGFQGTIIEWQRSSTTGGTWSAVSSMGTGSTAMDMQSSTGSYKYRVRVNCSDTTPDAFSNELTIEVKSASGGTVSPLTKVLCQNQPLTLTASGTFGESTIWQSGTNGNFNDISGATGNSYSVPTSSLGTTQYRVRANCNGINGYSSPAASVTVKEGLKAAICNDPDDLRKAVAKVTISGIPYAFSGFLINNTNNDGRLLFLTTSHPFTRYNPSATALSTATFTWDDDVISCSGGNATAVTSIGCAILATDGFFTLLELTNAPDLPLLWYLGWDLSATGTYSTIFQSATNVKKGKISTAASASAVSATISNANDVLTETNGSNVLKLDSWTSGNTEKRGRGAPLLSDKKARGVYIGAAELSCSDAPTYFADLAAASNTLMQHLRTGSQTNTATVKMNYCKPIENLSGVKNSSETYQVSKYIISSQNIADGKTVKYQAGTFVELHPGFVSGTDFVAEINPCVSAIAIIAPKRDEENVQGEAGLIEKAATDWIKIYPTVVNGNALTIETMGAVNGVELMLFDMQGKHLQSYRLSNFQESSKATISLPDLPSGIYFIKAHNGNNSLTQKLIVP